MESSKSLYESSTKQLVTLLESFASQFAVSSPPSKDSQDSEYVDSLLSRPSMDSDSYKAESDSCRPSISFNTFPSRPSIDSFYTVPSRPSLESFKTIPSEESFETIPSRLLAKCGVLLGKNVPPPLTWGIFKSWEMSAIFWLPPFLGAKAPLQITRVSE